MTMVLECFAAGMTEDEIVTEYPSLTADGIRAACRFGADLARAVAVPR